MDSATINSAITDKQLPTIKGKGFAQRAVAYLIDYLALYAANISVGNGVVTIISILLRSVVAQLIGKSYSYEPSEPPLLNLILSILISIAYFVIFEWLFGRTLGKWILRMRVVGQDGCSCTAKQSFVRAIYRLWDGLFFGAIAYSFMKEPLYLRLGDVKAKTVVVSSSESFIKETIPWWRFPLALLLFVLISGFLQSLRILLHIRFS